METKQQVGKGISYDHRRPDDKHYFGGFLNLAQNNIDGVIQEFAMRLNREYDPENKNQSLFSYFNINASFTDWERGVNILKEYWPMMEFIDRPATDKQFEAEKPENREAAKRKYFLATLGALLTSIKDLRHYYTHYYHPPVHLNDDLFLFLDHALLYTAFDVKKTKMKDDKTRQLLNQNLSLELEKLKKLKVEELKKKKEKGIKVNLQDEKGILNAIYNDAFAHIITKEKDSDKDKLETRYKSILPQDEAAETGINISISGLIFLLSLFLSRKEIEQLKSNIEGYKGKVLNIETEVDRKHNSLKYMATHWVFSILAFKGLKQRLTNSFEKESLLIQMMDELNKVPDELYQTLSETAKKEFLEDINEYVSEGDDNEKATYVVHPVIRKRYESKFNYFAIRYLDEFAQFPTLKFQIFVGQYLHDNRPKTLASNGMTAQRMIKEKINLFGNLSEVTKHKSDFFEKESAAQGWEFFPNPSYNWAGNNIPVYIDMIGKEGKAKEIQVQINKYRKQLNPAPQRDKRISKKEIIEQLYKEKVVYGDPTLMLSANELMALLYELIVNGKSGAELENKIVEQIIARYEQIEAYDPTTQQLPTNQMPHKLQKSRKDSKVTDTDKLLKTIDKEIDEGNKKLELIACHRKEWEEAEQRKKSGKRNNPGTKSRKHLFYASEMGEEATWIANDLKRFMPKPARAEWKGTHHSELQRLLAFYSTQRLEAWQLVESVWTANTHSFWEENFKEAFYKPEFENFYGAYIEIRTKILTTCRSILENNPEATMNNDTEKEWDKVFTLFDKRLYRTSTTDEQKKQLLTKPFAFPRGLFDDKPTFLPGSKPNENPERFAAWYSYGYTYSGKFQSFYDMPRNYSDWYKKLKEDGKLPRLDKKTEQEKILRFRMDCDLNIKHIRFQDIYVKLMVDSLYKAVFGQQPEFDLSHLYDTRSERYENNTIAQRQKSRQEGDNSDNAINENYVWNKTFAISLYNGRITESQVKLKDVGKFRRFATDPRVQTLISYDDTRTWTKLEIENELDNKADAYEPIRRTQSLKAIQQLEKNILKKNGFNGKQHPEELKHNGNPNFRKYIANGLLKHRTDIRQEELALISDTEFQEIGLERIRQTNPLIQKAYLLILLRNKFGHNQLPDQEHFRLMRSIYPYNQQESYSAYFNHVITQIIEELNT